MNEYQKLSEISQDTKDCTLHDSIYRKLQKRQNYIDPWLPRTRGWGRRLTAKEHQGTFRGDKNFLYLSVMVLKDSIFCKTHQMYTYTGDTAVSKIGKGLALLHVTSTFFSLHLTIHNLKLIEKFGNLC